MDFFILLDHRFFEWINSGLANSWFDWLMPILRNKSTWIPLYVFIAAILLWKFRWKGLLIILLTILTVAATDAVSSLVLKQYFQRLRPCNSELYDNLRLLIRCSPSFSLPSSHAANHFSMAVFWGITFFKKSKIILLTGLVWASAISFAQVYVGVHFPSDVLVGALVGSSLAVPVFYFSKIFLSAL